MLSGLGCAGPSGLALLTHMSAVGWVTWTWHGLRPLSADSQAVSTDAWVLCASPAAELLGQVHINTIA